MPNTSTINVQLPYLYTNQAQKEVLVNESLTRIDGLLNNGAVTRSLSTPPSTPMEGSLYIVGASPTGAWVGYTSYMALYNSGWRFIQPKEGMLLWVNDENKQYIYNGTDWNLNQALPSLTAGSVTFSDGTTLSQDNSNFFWNNTNKYLGIGTNAPSAPLELRATTENLRVSYNATNYLSVNTGSTGSTTFSLTGTSPTFGFSQSVSVTGTITASTNIILSGSIITNSTAVNANLATASTSSGAGTTTATTSQLLFAGATTINYRIFSRGGTATTLAANSSYSTLILGTPSLTAAASGTHALIAQQVIKAPSWTSGSATVTASAGLYIDNVSTGTVTDRNYAIWVASGETRLGGSLSQPITTVTSATTLSASHSTVLVDATSAAVTINLPAAAGCTGRIYNIKKIDSSPNTVTLDGNASETIDGTTTKIISAQWSSYQIQSNGTAWFIL